MIQLEYVLTPTLRVLFIQWKMHCKLQSIIVSARYSYVLSIIDNLYNIIRRELKLRNMCLAFHSSVCPEVHTNLQSTNWWEWKRLSTSHFHVNMSLFFFSCSVEYPGDYAFEINLGQPTSQAAKSVSWTVSIKNYWLLERRAAPSLSQ